MLIGRTNSSHNPLEPKFKLLDRREILKGDIYSIACGGKYKIFQKVYKQYFSGNKELMQNSRHSDGTCRIPDTTSLKETIALAYSLMRRRRAICSQRCLMNAANVCLSHSAFYVPIRLHKTLRTFGSVRESEPELKDGAISTFLSPNKRPTLPLSAVDEVGHCLGPKFNVAAE